jgi:rhodanese-related sulfurtransferase
MTAPPHHLIDVRTPSEYSTGYLSLGPSTAVNIEYQLIDQLPQVYLAHGISVDKTDKITLYCRSGRRSNIALQMLRELGYSNVRDIGGLEEARAVLMREEMLMAVKGDKDLIETGDVRKTDERDSEKMNEKKEARQRSLGTLLDGLRGLE